jgi:hypothetical protein
MWPIKLLFLLFILCTLLIFSLTIWNTSSFPTQLNKLNFSVPLQHHSSILSSYLWFIFCSVQCSAPYKSLVANKEVYWFLAKIKSNLLLKTYFIFKYGLCKDSTRFNFPCTPCIIWCKVRQIFESFQIVQLLLSLMFCGLDVCF